MANGEIPSETQCVDPYDDSHPEVDWLDPDFVENLRRQAGGDELRFGLLLAREKAEAEMEVIRRDPNSTPAQREEARRQYNAVTDELAMLDQQPLTNELGE